MQGIRFRPIAGALAALGIVLAACGGDDDETANTPAVTEPVTVETTAAPADDPETTEAAGPATTEAAAPATTAAPEIPAIALPLPEVVKLTMGSVPTASSAVFYIADARGYFEAENLDVEVTTIASMSETAPLLATGRIDVAAGGPGPALFNGINDGLPLKFVAPVGQSAPGSPSAAFVVDGDSDIEEVADLAGKKVATGAGGMANTAAWFLNEMLKQGDLTLDDVEVVGLGLADGLAALENGSVDAAIAVGGLLYNGISDGSTRMIGDMDFLVAGNGGGTVFGTNLLEENPQAGVAFVRAMLRAVQDLQGDYLADDEIVQIIADASGSTPEALRAAPPLNFDPTLALATETYLGIQQFWLDTQQLAYSDPLAVEQVVDPSFLELATMTLEL